VLIIIKCFATPWIIARWAIPVQPAWIIVPTLIFAVVATWIWVARRE
jgi:hypothetical protein